MCLVIIKLVSDGGAVCIDFPDSPIADMRFVECVGRVLQQRYVYHMVPQYLSVKSRKIHYDP